MLYLDDMIVVIYKISVFQYDPSEDQYLLGFQAGVKATEAKNLLSKDKTDDTDLNERILKGLQFLRDKNLLYMFCCIL